MVRFVETRWDAVRTPQEVGKVFPEAKGVEVRAMPLRSIFVALAKASRKVA
jgi:hypothetical protein